MVEFYENFERKMARINLGIRTWIFFIVLLLALIAIKPTFSQGIIIESVEGEALRAGLQAGQILESVNDVKIETLEDLVSVLDGIEEAAKKTAFEIETNEGVFTYTSPRLGFSIEGSKVQNVEEIAGEAGIKQNMELVSINSRKILNYSDFVDVKADLEDSSRVVVVTSGGEYIFLCAGAPQISGEILAKTRIKTGLDLQGGSRALVKPSESVSANEMSDLLEITRNRLNVFGISDVNVRQASDLDGNKFMLIEVAGATKKDLKELVGKQGKFEAKIGDEVVFTGGRKDITFVCRNDPTCAGIRNCMQVQGGYACKFEFAISLSPEAAQKHADVTAKLDVNITEQGKRVLSKMLELYLDDELTDRLQISEDLKGEVATQIAISGPGIGANQEEAIMNALENMKKLQTVLITGSLPFKLEIVKLDTVSPTLGEEFTKNILLVVLSSVLLVSLMIFLRYRKLRLALPMVLIVLSEIVIILGVAAFISWNLDIASIAGIIAAVGTGVDDQIVILDESRLGKQFSWKERLKRAFFIIFGAYATTFVAMLPLGWAGAGLLKGFAVTTIIGITIGVLITRPAFAEIVERLSGEED